MEIDRLDRKILNLLQANNRRANVDLAEDVGLSPPACLKRVRRLREAGVISADVAILSTGFIGKRLHLIVTVEMERDRAEIFEEFGRAIQAAEEVTQCYQVTGESDFILILSVPDIEAFEQFVHRVIHKAPHVRKFRTFISMKRVKFTTAIQL